MTAIRDFAIEATRRYLQSVVFVDDEIYVNLPGMVTPDVDVPTEMIVFGGNTTAAKAKPADAANTENDKEEEKPHYHPKQLVESFARERMVCALYEPPEGFATDKDSEIFRLCERADVVILDWDLYNEDGRNILPLLANLVSQSQTTVPHHVRLCAIYTTKPDLFKVCSQILEHLTNEELRVDALTQTKLDAGSSRIVVLGKPSTGRPTDQVEMAEVAESELASRIIKEFAAMHEGILPSMALHGMAAVRTSAKKILDKFGADMDGAFLVHRGLLLPADDAFEQLPELLAEEALAVMTDHAVPPEHTAQMSSEAIDAKRIKLHWQAKQGQPTAVSGQIAANLLKYGHEFVKDEFNFEKNRDKRVSELHAAMGANKTGSEKRLAALYNTRTIYSDRRSLTFGTIVRLQTEDEIRYSVCLMPICDSVRLVEHRCYKFPFWSLAPSNSGASSRGVVVEVPAGELVELFAFGKPRDRLWISRFTAGPRGTVEAAEKENRRYFTSNSGELEWIAQLKPNHAQRIAQDVGSSLSRVGLFEADWLRMKSERRS